MTITITLFIINITIARSLSSDNIGLAQGHMANRGQGRQHQIVLIFLRGRNLATDRWNCWVNLKLGLISIFREMDVLVVVGGHEKHYEKVDKYAVHSKLHNNSDWA